MAIQASSGSQREKWVAAFLPTMGILLVAVMYILFFATPALNKAESAYKGALSGAVEPFLVQQRQGDVQRLRNERDALRSTVSSFADEVTEKSRAFRQLSPTAKHAAVTALCRQHGVAVLADQTVDSIKLPELRNKSVETLQSLMPSDVVSFRELTVAADYATIVELLRKLPEEVPGVIPVSMTLKKKTSVDSVSESSSEEVSWTIGLIM